jgi:hypothetical protein
MARRDIEREELAIYVIAISALAPIVVLSIAHHVTFDGGTTLSLAAVVLGIGGVASRLLRTRAHLPRARVRMCRSRAVALASMDEHEQREKHADEGQRSFHSDRVIVNQRTDRARDADEEQQDRQDDVVPAGGRECTHGLRESEHRAAAPTVRLQSTHLRNARMKHWFVAVLVLAPALARADAGVAAEQPASTTSRISVGGYLEAFYQLHLQNPSNRITNLRGFDNRSRTLTLSNVALETTAERGPVATRIILQVGHTPSTYYLAEPTSPGTSGANSSSGELWKYIQTAYLTGRLPRAWIVEAGLFLSPIGPEVIPIKDNFNWSRSNLFFGLPFYHAGATVSHELGRGWTGKLHVYNGWNSVVDNNGYPSIALSAAFASEDRSTTGQLLYFGGVERAPGAAEGRPSRHLFDAYVQHALTHRFTVMAHGNTGLEPNDIGTSAWAAGAIYGKVSLADKTYLALRGDYFYEKVATDGATSAAAIFWPTRWITSGTASLVHQPIDGVSLRAEYRHDHAASDVFFGGAVLADPMSLQPLPNRRTQDSVTMGVVTWF